MNTALAADAPVACEDKSGDMFEVLAIVFGFVLLAMLAAVPLVLLMHAAERRQPVKDITPHDPA